MNQIYTESWWNKESNETKIEWFGLKSMEKSLFEIQKKFTLKFGGNDKNSNFETLIIYLNLI